MNIDEFKEIMKNVKDYYNVSYIMNDKSIEGYLDVINQWDNYNEDMDPQDIHEIKTSKLYSLFWGLLAIALNNNIISLKVYRYLKLTS